MISWFDVMALLAIPIIILFVVIKMAIGSHKMLEKSEQVKGEVLESHKNEIKESSDDVQARKIKKKIVTKIIWYRVCSVVLLIPVLYFLFR
ncbi:hypothetical protein V6478_003865 [Providencia rettgeri]|uniref:hypothetical protein n=1 Tax=Providencia TaxID=586 RepID=UPI000D7D6947|nr:MULTISPECIES: hypothetical protein [Providencia]QIF65383.1 hypothetical protein FVA72_07510 [Providencia sp. 1709051003]AWS52263.1 hypothetical protein AM461_16275 [Providencia rettgeri]EJD6475180.1 hypothetical protein [Providencia rettgeri]ELR5066483.1 hypothetical protein [Providencia rettgeri]ELR5163787.1 hypothetical protein [Providencia rettgeri]